MEHTELRTSRIFKVTQAVVFGDLTDVDTSQDFVFDAALPADAAIVGFGIDITTAFVNAGGTMSGDLGINGGDVDAFLDGAVDNLDTIAKVSTPAGIAPVGLVGAITPLLTVNISAGTLDNTTAGALVAEIYFIRTADQA